MILNKYIFILLAGLLIFGFVFQINFSLQSLLFAEVESEFKKLESEGFRMNEQTEIIHLQDMGIAHLPLLSFKGYHNVYFYATSNYFYLTIIHPKLFNHSPPQLV